MRKLDVHTEKRIYPVFIADTFFSPLEYLCEEDVKCVIITDNNVGFGIWKCFQIL